jgi:hypothetical protein
MLFDRTKLHEFRLWYHFGYFRYLPNLMQKIEIALPSCIRQCALLPSLAGMMVVGWA